jgi:hypothetical protein
MPTKFIILNPEKVKFDPKVINDRGDFNSGWESEQGL